MGNLLNLAMSVIPRVQFGVEKYVSNSTNSIGIKAPIYATPVSFWGCVQAVENSAYQKLNLEFGKNYIQVWGETDILGLDKQEVADRIVYNGRTFNVEKSTDWMDYNGWSSVIAVEDKTA